MRCAVCPAAGEAARRQAGMACLGSEMPVRRSMRFRPNGGGCGGSGPAVQGAGAKWSNYREALTPPNFRFLLYLRNTLIITFAALIGR